MVLTVVCFVNQKGGVGKTASVVNIGVGLAKFRKRVLMIDLDPQESLSYWLGINDPPKTIYDFFDGRESLQDCTVKHESGVDIVPSSEMLATLTPDINKFRDALTGQKYDYVLLDCSPTLGMTTLAALTASDWVIIPLFPDLLSLKGMSQLLGTINTIREETNPNLILKGIIATRYSAHKKMHVDVLEQIREAFPDISVFTVRDSIAVSESPVEGKSVLDYRPNSNGAKDYYDIARALVNTKYSSAAAKMLAQHALGINQNTALRQHAAVIEQAAAPKQQQNFAVIGEEEKSPEVVVNDIDKTAEPIVAQEVQAVVNDIDKPVESGAAQEVQADPQSAQAEEPAAEQQTPNDPDKCCATIGFPGRA